MKFLVLILAALGDTLFTTPALKALRNSYPDAEIDVIAWEDNKEILAGNDNIDRLIVCKGKGQLITELQYLRETVYDLAIGLSTVGSYISYLVNARKKLGFKGEELGWIYDFNVPDNRRIHAVDYCLEIVKLVGARPDNNPKLEIVTTTEDYRLLQDKLRLAGVSSGLPLVAIHPGGKYFSFKRWPAERFKELIKALDNTYNLEIVIIGGSDDQKLAQEIVDPFYNYNHRPKILAGKLKIKETVALLKNAALFIGNDSAPMHFAAAAGTSVIALIGPTNPANFHPYGTDYKLISAGLACSPCFSWLGELKQYLPEYLPEWATRCKARCMREIQVVDVLQGVETLIKEGKIYLSRHKQKYLREVSLT